MTELERHLLEALEQAQAQQQQKEADLRKMFEIQAGQSERQGSIQELVREHQRNRRDPKRQFEQISTACEQLERSVTGLQDTKQSLDRAITSARNAGQQVKEINEPKRSYGMRFGR
jgi:transcription termination factor NusB